MEPHSDQQQHQPHDRPLAAAANARPEPRPNDCNRILVGFCCDPDSKLGQSRHASRGCHVVRLTEEQEATKMTNTPKLVRQIHQLCDEGGDSNQQKCSFGRRFRAQVDAAGRESMKPSIPKKCKDTEINTWHCSKV